MNGTVNGSGTVSAVPESRASDQQFTMTVQRQNEGNTTALVLSPSEELSTAFLPVMSMQVAMARRQAIVEFVRQIMVNGQDYGVIPGTTGQKATLLKPGAEKLCCFFGLEPDYVASVEETDWTGASHNGELFYYVKYRCKLLRDRRTLGVGEGSCNSWESRYRWRDARRTCPACNTAAIFKSKQQPEWFCWAKKGGCGATFRLEDPAITGQQTGRIPNPDVADLINTIQKIAQKRALVAAVLIATSASEFFTQDIDDSGPEEDGPNLWAGTAAHAIDTGGAPLGTRQASQNVAARKLEELRASQPADTVDQKQKPWSTLAEFKRKIAPLREAVGETVFLGELERIGVRSLDELKPKDARKALELYEQLMAIAELIDRTGEGN